MTDLGPGDGGKGGVIHALSRMRDDNVNIIIKRGGAQGSHGICTSYVERFNFSQWGCGTFSAIPTFCSEQMILAPVGIHNEAEQLRRTGINDPYMLLSADPDCICATPFHRVASQLEELLLKDDPRGTIGSGVGQAYRMSRDIRADWTIFAGELTSRTIITRKLRQQATYYRQKYPQQIIDRIDPADYEDAQVNLALLYDEEFVSYSVDLFTSVGQKLKLQSLDKVLKLPGSGIVECSHGILTDAEAGLVPHVSAIRTLPKFTNQMLRSAHFHGEIINLAVHRAYAIRHGAGPLPTYDSDFTQQMLPHSHKETNRWQGEVRAGALDINLLRYALYQCLDTKFNGICLTWFDQIFHLGNQWFICDNYRNRPYRNEDYTIFLKNRAIPHLTQRQIVKKQPAGLFAEVDEVVQQYLGLPLYMLSVGPTEQDKIYSLNRRELS